MEHWPAVAPNRGRAAADLRLLPVHHCVVLCCVPLACAVLLQLEVLREAGAQEAGGWNGTVPSGNMVIMSLDFWYSPEVGLRITVMIYTVCNHGRGIIIRYNGYMYCNTVGGGGRRKEGRGW